MKRAAIAGELTLRHHTVETGNVQDWALNTDNFRPEVVSMLRATLPGPIPGPFPIRIEQPTEQSFAIWLDGALLSLNWVAVVHGGLDLHTSMQEGAVRLTSEQLYMLADVEECLAIALYVPVYDK